MPRRLVIPSVVLLATVGLAACSGSSSSPDPSASGGKTVGFLVFDAELDTFVTALVDAVQASAQDKGMQVSVVDGKNDAATQVAAVQQFVADGVDAILLYPGDPTTLLPAVQEAADKGIPVFTVNLNLQQGAPIITYIGSKDYDYGYKQGELLVKAIGESGNVGWLTGTPGTSAEIDRSAGFKDYIASYPGIVIVDQQADDWANDKALSDVQAWVAEAPDALDAVVAQGPEVADAAEWAQGEGLDIAFIAGDYPTELKQAIEDGAVYGTVAQYPQEQGQRAIDTIYRWLSGGQDTVKRPAEYTGLPIVTAENAASTPAAYE